MQNFSTAWVRSKCALVSILFACAVVPCHGADRADLEGGARAFPRAANAVATWSQRNHVALATTAREAVLFDFYQAGRDVQREKGLTDDVINGVASQVISEYLDREVGAPGTLRSMAAALRSALGVSGFSRPAMRKLARITIAYDAPSDQLRIGNEVVPAESSLLVAPGHFKAEGLKNNIVVCTLVVDVGAGEAVEKACSKKGAASKAVSIGTQNAAAHAALAKVEQTFRCPAHLDEVIKEAAKQKKIPPHLVVIPGTLLKQQLDAMIGVVKLMPAGPQRTTAIERISATTGVPVAEVSRLLQSGSIVDTEPPHFMTRPSAQIVLDNQASTLCSSQCATDVAWNVVSSITVWKSLCLPCSDDFLSVISLGDQHWVDTRALEWLRGPGAKMAASYPYQGKLDLRSSHTGPEALSKAVAASRQTGSAKIDGASYFELVSGDEMRKVGLCDLDT